LNGFYVLIIKVRFKQSGAPSGKVRSFLHLISQATSDSQGLPESTQRNPLYQIIDPIQILNQNPPRQHLLLILPVSNPPKPQISPPQTDPSQESPSSTPQQPSSTAPTTPSASPQPASAHEPQSPINHINNGAYQIILLQQ
jgi:hypothetical protein